MNKCCFFLLFLILLLFCPSGAMAGQIYISENNCNQEIFLHEGQLIELSLDANPTTGYSWQYAKKPDTNILVETEHGFRQKAPVQGDAKQGADAYFDVDNETRYLPMVGAGEVEYWVFQTSGNGATELSLEYSRPWEEAAAPLKSFTIKINVKPQITVMLDNSALEFDVSPVIEDGRTLVPLRAIFEALGAEIAWLPEKSMVIAKKNDKIVELTVGSDIAYRNGSAVKLDVAPKITGDRVLVPLRFVSEAMECKVDWDESSRIINITNQK